MPEETPEVKNEEQNTSTEESVSFEDADELMPTLPPDSWEELGNEVQGQGEEEKDVEGEQKAEEKEEGSAEESAPAEETQTPAMSADEKAKAWDNILDAWARDPAGTVEKFFNGLDDDAKAALIQKLSSGQQSKGDAQSQDKPFEFTEEPTTEFEDVIVKRKDWILRGDEIVEDKITSALAKYSEGLAPVIDSLWFLHAQNAALQEALRAVAGDVPEPDIEGMISEVKSGKAKDFKEAAKKSYAPKVANAIKASKQAARPRPSTPKSDGANRPSIREGMSMLEIASMLAGQGNSRS